MYGNAYKEVINIGKEENKIWTFERNSNNLKIQNVAMFDFFFYFYLHITL